MMRPALPIVVLVTALAGALGSQAAAQEAVARPKCSDAETAGADGGEKTKYEVVTGPDGKKIFRIKTGFVICGKVPKPDVLYGLLNTTINYEWENLKQNFLPKVLGSVEQVPF